jgi:hypothetical protein
MKLGRALYIGAARKSRPVVTGRDLEGAGFATEEPEDTAKPYLPSEEQIRDVSRPLRAKISSSTFRSIPNMITIIDGPLH